MKSSHLTLFQLIEGATRSWPDSEDSCIDHFWTNSIESIISKRNIVRSVGDHNLLEVVLRLKGSNDIQQEISKRKWKNMDLQRMQGKVANIDWENLYKITDLNLANDWMENQLKEVLNSEAPWIRVQPRRGYRSWILEETKIQMRKRDKTREEARENKNPAKWMEYKNLRNVCNKMVKSDRNKHFVRKYKEFEENKDTKNTYNLMKAQAGWKRTSSPTQFLVAGKVHNSPLQLANIQAEHYQDKVRELTQSIPRPQKDPMEHLNQALEKWDKTGNRTVFSLQSATESEVLQAVKDLGNTTSCGLDGIDAVFLKANATALFRPLTYLTNLSINNSCYANKWKLAKVLPLYKGKGKDRNSPASFRPISMLPVISKIVERIVQHQLMRHMMNTGQLNTQQHSYRKTHSTTTALAEITDQLHQANDENLISCLLSVDQSSAFDCVSHEILLKKLEKYNCDVKTVTWFKNYLNFRSQCVQVGTKLSNFKSVSNGVPQGSVLGPVLYSIYTNELSSIISQAYNCQHSDGKSEFLFGNYCSQCGNITCYADDASLIFSSNSRNTNQIKLKEGLDIVSNFLFANNLRINRSKTTIMEVMTGQKRAKTGGNPPILSETDETGNEKLIFHKRIDKTSWRQYTGKTQNGDLILRMEKIRCSPQQGRS